MNYGMVLAATAVMALVTYLPRMLPMAVIKRKIQNRFIRSFLFLQDLFLLNSYLGNWEQSSMQGSNRNIR